jgi:hypothetical protein
MDSLSFGIFEAGTIGGRLPVEHRFNLLLRDPQSAPGRSDSSRNCQYFGMLLGELDELSTWKLWIVAHLWGGPICCCGLEEKTPNATAGLNTDGAFH